MERYDKCSDYQKQVLNRLYEYLGFNEVISYNDFLMFVFYNTRNGITFEQMVNHLFKHIVMSFTWYNPQYSKYVPRIWYKESEFIECMNVGSDIELDKKGVIRHFVKNNYISLIATKR